MSKSKSRETKRGRPTGKTSVKAPTDRHAKKHTSSGVQAVICAIQEGWNGATSQENFARDFAPVLRDIGLIYRGHERTAPDRSHDGVQKFVDRLAKGEQDIAFHEQRAFATYLGGIPVGLFMLYTQMVSDASHKDTKEDILNLLDAFSDAIAVLKQWMRSGNPVGLLIDREPTENKDGFLEFKAKLEGLKKAVNIFSARREVYNDKHAIHKIADLTTLSK